MSTISQTNRILGTFTVSRPSPQHVELIAGRHVGSRTGYASVAAAMRAAAFLTQDNGTSVGILRRHDRYFAYQLLERNLGAGLFAPLRRAALEPNRAWARAEHFRTNHRDSQLEAIVDGAFAHRFHG